MKDIDQEHKTDYRKRGEKEGFTSIWSPAYPFLPGLGLIGRARVDHACMSSNRSLRLLWHIVGIGEEHLSAKYAPSIDNDTQVKRSSRSFFLGLFSLKRAEHW